MVDEGFITNNCQCTIVVNTKDTLYRNRIKYIKIDLVYKCSKKFKLTILSH